jgi:hypothetical protein
VIRDDLVRAIQQIERARMAPDDPRRDAIDARMAAIRDTWSAPRWALGVEQLEPITGARITGDDPAAVAVAAAAPELARLRALTVSQATPLLDRLRSLRLQRCVLGARGVRALVERVDRLRALAAEQVELGPGAIEALLRSPAAASLERLGLRDIMVSPRLLRHFLPGSRIERAPGRGPGDVTWTSVESIRDVFPGLDLTRINRLDVEP